MDFKKAIEIRNSQTSLIDTKPKDFVLFIFDVIVIPVNHADSFLSFYRTFLKSISNEEMLMKFPDNDFEVKLILKNPNDPEFINLIIAEVTTEIQA